ncbi:MAG: alkyl sulfatase dimerization domain-containing protein [Candidatus Binatus sp.]|uniref:alkyl sulfatase dimerization domain-containing protein n=1 Tax=Candidatus Binatus sp. TaxID=2811406 RepID=UPI002715F46A|nr:alkyl sulfatase dimerization domain-containing protein [Candidatus Binatus sp.]MDO8433761.1 alkyl sulfatase dimerization domain-containing protein [Candidatus Binatus sp.]
MPNAYQGNSLYSFDPMMGQLEVIEPGIAMFHGYANSAFAYGRGEMLAVDTSSRTMGAMAVARIREVTAEPFAFLIYSHGLGDHAFGTEAFIRDAIARGFARPKIWAHEDVAGRFDLFRMTRGWHSHVNRMQFGNASAADEIFGDDTFSYPDLTYRGTQFLDLAGEPVELHHAMAETDDATWVWMPARRLAMVGDLIVSAMPNTGNPNKAQRYTLEWAQALERIAHRKPQYVLPGHGPAYQGEQMCEELLTETARALRYVHDEVVQRLNAGQWPIDIVEANIALPDDLADKPFLKPVYGCVPFIVRDVIRRYAGWWSGEPSQMLPAPRREHCEDLIALCGRDAILARARSLMEAGELRRALSLAEVALNADKEDAEPRALNAEILEAIVSSERSFIARNFFAAAAKQLRNHAM